MSKKYIGIKVKVQSVWTTEKVTMQQTENTAKLVPFSTGSITGTKSKKNKKKKQQCCRKSQTN